MNLLKVLMFVFVSSLVCQNAYPQQDKFDSELGLFASENDCRLATRNKSHIL